MTVLSDVAIARAALGVFSPADAVVAVAIALAESGGNPTAHNSVPPDDSYGLWQINMLGALGPARRAALGLHADRELLDPATNARAAAMVRHDQGWQAWSVYLHREHVRFLGRAGEAVTDALNAGVVFHRVLRAQSPYPTGRDVRAVQRMVGAPEDGVYGPVTAERVTSWQSRHHLTADGVWGPASTRAAGWTWGPA